MRNEKYFALIQGLTGGLIAGIALSQVGLFLMPLALAFLWSASSFPLAGSIWGGTAILVSHRWILGLHPLNWLGIPPILSLLITILIFLFCGLLGSFLCGGWCWLGQVSFLAKARDKSLKRKFFSALFLSSIWGLAEVILAQLPLFWIGVGNALLPADRWLSGLARWFGTGGLVIVQMLIGWWIWQVFLAFKRGKSWQMIFSFGLAAVFFAHCLGWFLLLNEKAFDQKQIALWQTGIPIREKFSQEQFKRFPKSLKEAFDKAENMNAFLMVAPEGTIYFEQPLQTPTPIPFLSGGFRSFEGRQRSSIFVFNQNQKTFSNVLDKHRLVPLGEWFPSFFGFTFKGLSALGGLEPGNSSRILFWDGPPLAGAICYELSDGRSLAEAVDNGAEWIVSIANLDPYPLLLQKQFVALAQLRSIETGRDVVIAANTGPTSLISNNGKVTSALPPFLEGVGLVKVHFYKGKTAYVKLREWPLIIFLMIGFFQLKPFNIKK